MSETPLPLYQELTEKWNNEAWRASHIAGSHTDTTIASVFSACADDLQRVIDDELERILEDSLTSAEDNPPERVATYRHVALSKYAEVLYRGPGVGHQNIVLARLWDAEDEAEAEPEQEKTEAERQAAQEAREEAEEAAYRKYTSESRRRFYDDDFITTPDCGDPTEIEMHSEQAFDQNFKPILAES